MELQLLSEVQTGDRRVVKIHFVPSSFGRVDLREYDTTPRGRYTASPLRGFSIGPEHLTPLIEALQEAEREIRARQLDTAAPEPTAA